MNPSSPQEVLQTPLGAAAAAQAAQEAQISAAAADGQQQDAYAGQSQSSSSSGTESRSGSGSSGSSGSSRGSGRPPEDGEQTPPPADTPTGIQTIVHKITHNRLFLAVLSLLIAFGVWLYYTANSENPEPKRIDNIPVTFVGEEILGERSLMILGEYSVSVTARATPSILSYLNNHTMQVLATVSGITTEGTHNVAYVVVPPTGIDRSQVSIESDITGSSLMVEVARFTSREIPVVGRFTGSVADGYLAGNESDFSISPSRIVVSGILENVNQIQNAVVTIADTDLTESVTGEYPFVLTSPSGDPLTDLDVTCDVESVYVNFPVQAIAEIPLTVNLIDGGGVSADTVDLVLSNSSITVGGTKDAVEAVKASGAITLATLDLAAVTDGETLSFPVPLADELNNVSGVTEVTVTIHFKEELETRTFTATSINVFNVPEGWTAQLMTQALPMDIRGPSEILDQITPENIQVSADCSALDEKAGLYSVPVTVLLHRPETKDVVGILASDFRVVLDLQEAIPEPSPEPTPEVTEPPEVSMAPEEP